MDTRYWGPSGWRLLHLIAHGGRGPLAEFFGVLPYVLPCKHCRANLSEHIEADPIPKGAEAFPRWLWRIHNAVNAKLRQQGIGATAPSATPPFEKVRRIYEDRLAAGCSRTHFEGWEFLFSVGEAHPHSRAAAASTPIAGAPPAAELAAAEPLERNRWNVMTPDERLPYYTKFWELLPQVFPFPEWTRAWRTAATGSEASCRSECLKGVWRIRRAMEEELELLNRTSYAELCKELRDSRSWCGAAARGKTCRRRRRTHRHSHGSRKD